jgi:hypothetical protein
MTIAVSGGLIDVKYQTASSDRPTRKKSAVNIPRK